MNNKISIIILTKNEEKNILDCIEPILSSDEIIIIDDYSTDRTVEVIKGLGKKNIRIFQHKLDSDFSEQRNFGLSKTNNDWVLFIDADERASSELCKEIENLDFSGRHRDTNGFYIKRRDVMWGRELKYGETGNIKLIRLANKHHGKWKGRVHETWDIKGSVQKLDNALMHYPHPKVKDFLEEISFYSTMRAKELHDKKTEIRPIDIILYPKTKFFINYVLKFGFLDGIPGLLVAIMMSFHSFLVRSKLWQLSKK